MAQIKFIVSALPAASALLLIGLAIPLIRGSVPMNHWYGVQFRASFTSPDAWCAINRYGGWQAVGWSLPLFVLGGLAHGGSDRARTQWKEANRVCGETLAEIVAQPPDLAGGVIER